MKLKKKAGKSVKKKQADGESLDDAFADDSDVIYAPTKPRKEKKKYEKGLSEDEIEEEIEEAEDEVEKLDKEMNENESTLDREIVVKNSKPVSKIKKGDKIRIDGTEYEVDSHYVLIDHGTTKEMAIEIFNPKTDKDYQLRYFDDQAKETIELYELQDIMYIKKPFVKIDW